MQSWNVVYHPGREQPFTVYGPDGHVWQFCCSEAAVDGFLQRHRKRRL